MGNSIKYVSNIATLSIGLFLAYSSWKFYGWNVFTSISLSGVIYIVLTIVGSFFYYRSKSYALLYTGLFFLVISIIYYFLPNPFPYVEGFIYNNFFLSGISIYSILMNTIFFRGL